MCNTNSIEIRILTLLTTAHCKTVLYMLAFVCIIRLFAETYKQTAFICKETNSIKFRHGPKSKNLEGHVVMRRAAAARGAF